MVPLSRKYYDRIWDCNLALANGSKTVVFMSIAGVSYVEIINCLYYHSGLTVEATMTEKGKSIQSKFLFILEILFILEHTMRQICHHMTPMNIGRYGRELWMDIAQDMVYS